MFVNRPLVDKINMEGTTGFEPAGVLGHPTWFEARRIKPDSATSPFKSVEPTGIEPVFLGLKPSFFQHAKTALRGLDKGAGLVVSCSAPYSSLFYNNQHKRPNPLSGLPCYIYGIPLS